MMELPRFMCQDNTCKNVKSIICISLIVERKGHCPGTEYFCTLQRGGLSIPTDYVMIILFHMSAISQSIRQSFRNQFRRMAIHKFIRCKPTLSHTFNVIDCVFQLQVFLKFLMYLFLVGCLSVYLFFCKPIFNVFIV